MMSLEPSNVTSILVIKLRAVGDVLLSTVVLKNLRARFPNARIDFLTEKGSCEVVEGHPCLSSVLVFDTGKDNGPGLIFKVRRRQYDLVIDLFGNPRSALVTYLSGARYRVGYRFNWRQYCYNIVVQPRGSEIHNTEFNLDALRAIGVPIVDTSLFFPVTTEDERFVDRFFSVARLDGRPLIALNPGGGWYTKRWPVSRFARLGDFIVDEYHAQILLLWGPGEEKIAREIKSLMKSPAVLIPPCTLKQLAGILQRCTAMVTNDSGPMHIAAVMGTPVVAIYGPTHPELQGPVGDRHVIVQNEKLLCLGCNYTSCPIGHPCMEGLSVEAVLEGVERLIGLNGALKRPSPPHLYEKREEEREQ